ncbi:Rhodanese-related sulfurtransferase [Desulfitobacterium dichloroeliminans LMG P-21439]|uniref:Rhodanese-related sulfurtransferase n=1 Tax=Desulfitobacterium dichloroeliminans (strain LMG P-21439 / DCA1) TaxID=871963 RepID=L0F628_DESDL|nr:rhodanese-like domain-containing protein [Desulfitobacterium dichloroeliminans]AGA68490.1 Rhodanese-related sulfurtransferase [Desulfitobacterium dichloroeliminans LMG P-21439]
MLRKYNLLVLILLLVVTSLAIGCSSQPASQPSLAPSSAPAPVSGAPTQDILQTNLLEFDAWEAKMAGEINLDYYVIDLRSPAESQLEKSIEGSINIDANETLAKGNVSIINEKLSTVPEDAIILLHCKSGGRVKANLAKFVEAGYSNVYGLNGWTAFDAKGYIGAAKINANTEHIKPDAWVAKMSGEIGKDYFIIDTRNKIDHETGYIKGAINLGAAETFTVDHSATMVIVEQTIPNKDSVILVHCNAGTKARVTQAHLKAEGYKNVFVLDNRMVIDKGGNYTFE